MLIYRSDAERARTSSMRGLSILSAPMSMPAFAARTLSAHPQSAHFTPAQLTMAAGWRAAKQVRGGRISGYDVTDNAFSTRMGPPSYSPPV